MALQATRDRVHGFLTQGNATWILLVIQLHDGRVAFPRHALGPRQHRVDIAQQRSLPVQFSNAPAPFKRIVFAVIGRVVQELKGFANLVSKLHDAMEKLRAHPPAFGSVIHFQLQPFGGSLRVSRQGRPPSFQSLDADITRLGGTAKGNAQLPSIFIYQSPRNILRPTAPVVLARLHVTSRESSSRKFAELHCRFTIAAPALDGPGGGRVRVFF